MSFIPIAPYCPDDAVLNSECSENICNVLLGLDSYTPMPSLEPISQEIKGEIYGSLAMRDAEGKVIIFVATGSKLFMMDNGENSWRDISRESGPYAASKIAQWNFAIFGNYIIAVNANDKPQIFEIGRSTKFRDMAGNPPRAGLVKIWGDFVCLMQLPDHPNRVHWSGLNDAEFWKPGERNCDYQDFPQGGRVQNSSEDSNPIIFLESAIYYGQFIPGSDIIFSFRKLQDRQGLKFYGSLAGRGQTLFYVDEGGFFQISSDGTTIPIGYGKVNSKISSHFSSEATNIKAAIDPYNSRVYWAIDYSGSGVFTELLVYDWMQCGWSRIELELKALMAIYSIGYTLEGLDKVSKSIDDLPYSLDDPKWRGGRPVLGAIDVSGRLCSFSGPAMAATIESQEFSDMAGNLQKMDYVRPIVDSDNFTISIGEREKITMPISWASVRKPARHTGRVHVAARARYLRFRLNIPAGVSWTHIRGFETQINPAGAR
ncbi:hypothetical protein [Bartonella sp. TP]|uniref:hypothetical protein n=1 Tax=Bartonella sp. TP TaxID=3057550 RepID=UPI0025B18E72|nr:hypothetical protein [Bartonella sp. TP]WJW80506.1 hypothetical protein QVL57_02770 [Bartonella sp. TP]